jgi:hypothetical protein
VAAAAAAATAHAAAQRRDRVRRRVGLPESQGLRAWHDHHPVHQHARNDDCAGRGGARRGAGRPLVAALARKLGVDGGLAARAAGVVGGAGGAAAGAPAAPARTADTLTAAPLPRAAGGGGGEVAPPRDVPLASPEAARAG